MLRLAELADNYAAGEVRLSVWQNFIIPNVPDAYVQTLKRALEKMGLGTRQSNVTSGIVACTGSRYCKFAQSDTKGHALELSKYLEKRIQLDQPVNIHLTGCPNSCAQHYIGDIGCLGTRVRDGAGSVDAYHVFVGGGFGKSQTLGRQIFTGVAATELPRTLERILRAYLQHRQGHESFQQFSTRHDLGRLQEIFGGEA
jgi:ferredoxin-nitrite reductase